MARRNGETHPHGHQAVEERVHERLGHKACAEFGALTP